MPKTVDARGQACPQPVLLTRTALQESDAVLTIVDNDTARQNVTRMAEKAGCVVQVEQRADGIYLNISKGSAAAQQRLAAPISRRPKWSAGACDSERHDGPGR